MYCIFFTVVCSHSRADCFIFSFFHLFLQPCPVTVGKREISSQQSCLVNVSNPSSKELQGKKSNWDVANCVRQKHGLFSFSLGLQNQEEPGRAARREEGMIDVVTILLEPELEHGNIQVTILQSTSNNHRFKLYLPYTNHTLNVSSLELQELHVTLILDTFVQECLVK